MALSDTKIRPSDYEGRDIAGLPDRPALSAANMKARFDALSKEVLAPKHNAAVELLTGESGAAQIGTTGGGTVQGILDASARKENVLEKNNTAPFAPTADFQPATKKYVDDASFASGAVSSVFGRAGHVTAQAGDYSAAQVGAYTKNEVLAPATAQALSLAPSAVPNDAFARLAGQEAFERLIAQSGVRLEVVSGVPQVLSLDLTGINLGLYRQLKLFLRGKGKQWSANGRILIRINNDASTSPNRYVSTTMRYMRGDENNTPSGPVWTGAFSDNRGLLAQMDIGNFGSIRNFALSAEFMTSGSVVVAEGICMMPPFLSAFYGGYDLNATAFSSINIAFSGNYEENYLELDEVALLGLKRGT